MRDAVLRHGVVNGAYAIELVRSECNYVVGLIRNTPVDKSNYINFIYNNGFYGIFL